MEMRCYWFVRIVVMKGRHAMVVRNYFSMCVGCQVLGCRQLYNDSGLHLESKVIDCPTRTRTLNTKEEREKMIRGVKSKDMVQNIDGVKNY